MNEPAPSIVLTAAPAPTRTEFRASLAPWIRAGWWLTFGAIVVMNVIALPLNFQLLQRECVGGPCIDQQLNFVALREWLALGLGREAYAVVAIALALVPAVIFVAIALILFRGKPNERIIVFTSLALMLFGGVTYPGFVNVLVSYSPLWWYPTTTLDHLGHLMVIGFFYVFPNGEFVPRWTRIALGFLAVDQVLEILRDTSFSLVFNPFWVITLTFPLALGTAIYAQLYRYRRVSNNTERRQTKWVVYATAITLIGVTVVQLVYSLSVPLQQSVVATLMVSLLLATLVSLLPLSIAIAMLKTRLWDIDLIINRTLVYGTMTAIVAGMLAVMTDLAKKFFLALTGEASEIATIAATLVIVAAFDPIRKRVQDFVDRHFKYATGTFGPFADEVARFVQVSDPDALARRFLDNALSNFGAESGAVYLGQGEALRLVKRTKKWDGHAALAIPIKHAGTQVGLIALGARANGDTYDEQDRASLQKMADLVAHAVQLTEHVEHDSPALQPPS